jgi:hypothetical protein
MAKSKNPSKKGLSGELGDLAKILTGEMKLRMKEEKVEVLKKKAIERQKDIRREKIVTGEEVMEKDDPTEKKVVQNIKLYEWEAPIRFKMPFDARTYLITVGACLVFIVFLAVLGHYGLMASIVALLFFVYVAGTIEPVSVKHRITTRGIDTLGKLYEWFMLESFWFTRKDGQELLVVETKLRAPTRLMLLISEKDRSALFVLLQDKLLYREIKKQGRVEKMSFGEYIPLEKI